MLEKKIKGLVKFAIGSGLILLSAKALDGKTHHDGYQDNSIPIVEYADESTSGLDSFIQQETQQANQKTMDYTQAVSASTIDEKIRLLEEYVSKYNDSPNHKYAYAELVYIYQTKGNFDKIIVHGEKALAYTDLDSASRTQVLMLVANGYASSPQKKDLNKAKDYVEQAYQLANTHKNEEGWANLFNSTKNARTGINDFIERSKPKPKKKPQATAYTYYNQKNYAQAEKEFTKLDQKDPKVNYFYGRTLFRLKKYDLSIEKLVAASLLDPAAYSKSFDTAKNMYLSRVYKDPKTKKDYNTLLQGYNNNANAEIAQLTNKFNEKWTEGKELTEEDEIVYDRELKSLNADIELINKELTGYQNQLKKAADAGFDRIVARVKQSIGVK